ncbi:Indoleamine 2,3-dioxygenase [Cladochytrium replicatum]|nr:Indoleamine 2,3-dioxygenase [Cladochytrium replicatum]
MPSGPVPKLENYGIHPVYGFLPMDPPPLKRLPNPYFEPWEQLMDELHHLILVGALRSKVKQLPILDADRLSTERERERGYVVMCFLAHGYVWGFPKIESPETILPAALAVPWVKVAKSVGRQPVISYSASETFNFRLIDPNGPVDLSNVSTLHTFTGSMDESWFYMVAIAMEKEGAVALTPIVSAMEIIGQIQARGDAPTAQELETIAGHLDTIADAVGKLAPILHRMYERNDPYIFYHRTRPYQAGWKGNPEVMPKGVFYEGVLEANDENVVEVTPTGTWRIYPGASAGQSPIIHTLDVALGVHHLAMGNHHNPHKRSNGVNGYANGHVNGAPKSEDNPMLEMRKSLSEVHRRFLLDLQAAPSIHDFVAHLRESTAGPLADRVVNGYNRCVEEMRRFRDKHIQIVTTYIVIQAKRASGGVPPVSVDVGKRQEEGGPKSPTTIAAEAQQGGVTGTGGTDLIPFLKQTRKETVNALVD